MNIKNVALGTLLGMGMGAGQAVAAPADNFAGFSLSVGASAQSSTVETREKGEGDWYTSSGATADTFSYDRQIQWPSSTPKLGGQLDLGYNLKVADRLLLGVGVTGDFMKLLSGKTKTNSNSSITCDQGTAGETSAQCGNYSAGSDGGGGTDATGVATLNFNRDPNFDSDRVTVKNRYGIVLRPMFAVTDSTAVFLKASYNQASASGFGPSMKLRGPGYGFGFESNLSESWFLRAELEQVQYSGRKDEEAVNIDVDGTAASSMAYDYGKTSIDTKVTIGTIAIGLRF